MFTRAFAVPVGVLLCLTWTCLYTKPVLHHYRVYNSLMLHLDILYLSTRAHAALGGAWPIKDSFGLFLLVSKQLCLFMLFR